MIGLVGLCCKPQLLVIIIIIIITAKRREVKEGGVGKKGKGRGREMEGRLVRRGRGGKRVVLGSCRRRVCWWLIGLTENSSSIVMLQSREHLKTA